MEYEVIAGHVHIVQERDGTLWRTAIALYKQDEEGNFTSEKNLDKLAEVFTPAQIDELYGDK